MFIHPILQQKEDFLIFLFCNGANDKSTDFLLEILQYLSGDGYIQQSSIVNGPLVALVHLFLGQAGSFLFVLQTLIG